MITGQQVKQLPSPRERLLWLGPRAPPASVFPSLLFVFCGLCFWDHRIPKTSLWPWGQVRGCAPPNPRAEDGTNHQNPAPVILPSNKAFLLSKRAVPEAHSVSLLLISSLLICSAVPGLEWFPEVRREWRMEQHTPSPSGWAPKHSVPTVHGQEWQVVSAGCSISRAGTVFAEKTLHLFKSWCHLKSISHP